MMCIEIWKDVKGYEGIYQVSNIGRVKSLSRKFYRCDGISYIVKEKYLTIRKDSFGYSIVKLSKNNKGSYKRVHRLVAESFIENPNNLSEVNHIDCVRDNNVVENLEWISHLDNVRYSIKKGNHISCRDLTGKNNPNYNNHKLHEFYKTNPHLAVELLGRKGKQNGRARKINLYDNNKTFIKQFNYIGECAEYLKEIYNKETLIDSMRRHISNAAKKNVKYLNHYYKFVS